VSGKASVLEHDALMYERDDVFVGALVPFLRGGLEAEAPVAIATTAPHIDLLREALGADSAHVRFFLDEDWFVQPATTIHRWQRELRRRAANGDAAARFVGEVRFGEEPARRRMWTRFESALNAALAQASAWIVCPYDLRRLPAGVIEDATRTHPTVWDRVRGPSASYEPTDDFLRSVEEFPIVTEGAPALSLQVGTTPTGGRAALRALAGTTLPRQRADDLVVAAGELLTNSIVHAGATGSIDAWARPGEIVVEVSDRGEGVVEQVAGYRPPRPGELGGRGLWLVRRLADAVTIHSEPGTRTSVRIAVRDRGEGSSHADGA
jgi:anti-sigma regulatory factor (Ser/Thr protein kinase)